MRRRVAMTLLGATAIGGARGAVAQQVPVIGFVRNSAMDDMAQDWLAAFRAGLREGGFRDGQNVEIDVRAAPGGADRLAGAVAELVRRNARVIVGNSAAALAARAATRSVPILFATGGDPIRDGLVSSLSRPGENVTGVTFLDATLSAKQLDIVRELVPAARTVGFIVDTSAPPGAASARDAAAAAAAAGLRLIVANAATDAEIDAAFVILAEQGAAAFMASGAAVYSSRRRRFVALAERHRLPAVYQAREFVTAGGLMSYGGSIPEAYRQAGLYAARILDGAAPGTLPVIQSSRIELVANLGTARALGLAIPPALLARADEVIE